MCKKITFRNLEIQAWIWLGLPMLLFLYGWMRWYVSLPLGLMIVLAAVRYFSRSHGSDPVGVHGWKDVAVTPGWMAALVVIAALLVFCGMGGMVAQHWDYQWRNAVFFDLAKKDWPVVYDSSVPRYLCYYFGYWLPAAVVSKMTGYIVPGDLFQLLWGLWGLSIGYTFLVGYLGGRSKWWILPVLVLFGCWDSFVFDVFGAPIARFVGLDASIDIYSYYMSFSFLPQIRMIFNQTVALWVALPLLYARRLEPETLLLPAGLLFLYSPLPCVGISVAMAWWLVKGGRRSLSFQNVTGALVIIVTGLYFMSNNNASGADVTSTLGLASVMLLGILFFVLAVGVWLPFVWDRVRRNSTFIILVITGFLLPLLSLGDSDDLGRRAIMPLTIMLTYMVLAEIGRWNRLALWKKIALPVVLLVGSYDCYIMTDMTFREIEQSKERGNGPKLIYMMDHLDDPERNYHYDNFISEGESFYSRWMMRRTGGYDDDE